MENFADVKYILDGFLFVFAGILVMWMAAGFAMLEAGLTRTKNNATVLTKNMSLFAISCIMYYFVLPISTSVYYVLYVLIFILYNTVLYII